jgi:hypothetical protein
LQFWIKNDFWGNNCVGICRNQNVSTNSRDSLSTKIQKWIHEMREIVMRRKIFKISSNLFLSSIGVLGE